MSKYNIYFLEKPYIVHMWSCCGVKHTDCTCTHSHHLWYLKEICPYMEICDISLFKVILTCINADDATEER